MVDDIYEKKEPRKRAEVYGNFEVVDVDVVRPEDVDLGLTDEAPFEIGIETVQRMDEEEAARKQALIENVRAESTKDNKVVYKDVMFMSLADIMDAYQADKKRVALAIITFITFIGTFLPFWGVKVGDLSFQSMTNLFNGYQFFGIVGKIYVLSLVAALVFVSINLKKWGLRCNLVGWIAFIAQIIIILIFAPMDYAIPVTTLRPHIGIVITLIGQIAALITLLKICKRPKQVEKED